MEKVTLTDQDVAYVVGHKGQTRIRLENFSGAHLNIDHDAAEVRNHNRHAKERRAKGVSRCRCGVAGVLAGERDAVSARARGARYQDHAAATARYAREEVSEREQHC